MTEPHFIVDRVEGGYAVVWSALIEDTLDVPLSAMPDGLTEGDGLTLVLSAAGASGSIRLVAVSNDEAVLAVESVLRLGSAAAGLPSGAQPGADLTFERRPADEQTAAMAARIRRLTAADDGGDWSI